MPAFQVSPMHGKNNKIKNKVTTYVKAIDLRIKMITNCLGVNLMVLKNNDFGVFTIAKWMM